MILYDHLGMPIGRTSDPNKRSDLYYSEMANSYRNDLYVAGQAYFDMANLQNAQSINQFLNAHTIHFRRSRYASRRMT